MSRELDKSKWAKGVWDREPDYLDGVDDVTGYLTQIKRNNMGALCGYVGIPEGHPAYGKGYYDVSVNVHGGLTYAEQEFKEPVYWFGFDCNHTGDVSPYMEGVDPFFNEGGTYRDIEYVKTEIAALAVQLKELEVTDEKS